MFQRDKNNQKSTFKKENSNKNHKKKENRPKVAKMQVERLRELRLLKWKRKNNQICAVQRQITHKSTYQPYYFYAERSTCQK